ncbi:uncharacterized protein DEA37_0012288 [Paragonimus westermani]|uniref:Uncharacterized protein n=1 Tax=Paragonimus westermani TaxID=34504 RepID=A0A5J4NZV4_9TREM|nr:uncharacterized protein DEA37_0012288 [Paragonimus westermani]
MPYLPFSKDMRLGRVADWSGNVYQDIKSKGRYMSQFSGAQYAYIHDENDSNFQLVSSARDIKSSNLGKRYRLPIRGRRIGVGRGYVNMGTRGGYMPQSGGVYQNWKLRNMSGRDRMQQNRRRY